MLHRNKKRHAVEPQTISHSQSHSLLPSHPDLLDWLAGKPSRTVRVTVSFPEKVDQWAEELMAEKGFDNFSAYIADLIRRDREQHPAVADDTVPGPPSKE